MPTEYIATPEMDLDRTDGAGVHLDPVLVPDVERAFLRIRDRGELLRATDGSAFKLNRYTASAGNNFGIQNHFQGMLRLQNQPYALVTGGDPHETMSHLFVIKLESKQGFGGDRWHTNALFGDPLGGDSLARIIELDTVLWHAGGPAVLGDLVAVPLEASSPAYSRIVFLDLADPDNPKRLAPDTVDIKRPGKKAGAVALAQLADGRVLCAVWDNKHLDCYLSRGSGVSQGFEETPRPWSASECRALGSVSRTAHAYQSTAFVHESSGALYWVGNRNTVGAAPQFNGDDEVDVFTFAVPDEWQAGEDGGVPTVSKVLTVKPKGRAGYGNFISAGVHIGTGGEVRLYSVWPYLRGSAEPRQFRFMEFSPDPSGRPVDSRLDGWVELYEQPFFGGRFFGVRGPINADIVNYNSIFVQAATRGFGDKVKSARFQLAPGDRYDLFRDDGYDGDVVSLDGTGDLGELSELPEFGVSSSGYPLT